jgi:hypothetical protein
MEEGFCFIYVAGITSATRQSMLLEVLHEIHYIS